MSSSRRSKSDQHGANGSESEKRSRELRDFQQSDPANKRCFDCGQRGPTYVNVTVGSFVCTKCSGMLRGITPPHRIKSLSMSSFTAEEVAFVRSRGNVWAARVFLGLHDDSDSAVNDLKDDDAVKEFIIEKYEKKRYYVDPSHIVHTLKPANPSPGPHPTGSVSGNSGGRNPGDAGKTSNLIGAALNARMAAHHLHNSSSNGGQRQQAQLQFPAFPSPAQQPSKSPVSAVPAASAISRPSPQPQQPQQQQPPPQQQIQQQASKNNGQLLADLTSGSSDPFGGAFSPNAGNSAASSDSNFANFDEANFDAPPLETLHPPSSGVSLTTSSQPMGILPTAGKQQKSQEKSHKAPEDRYAALKDLDEIFRSSMAIKDQAAPVSHQSTGVSLFGSSPVQAAAVTPTQPPGGSTNQSVRPASGSSFDVFGGAFGGKSSDHLPTKVHHNEQRQHQVASPPVNPFTGTANLSQLNTSPWPTTGNSPVNTGSHSSSTSQWPKESSSHQWLGTSSKEWPGSNSSATTQLQWPAMTSGSDSSWPQPQWPTDNGATGGNQWPITGNSQDPFSTSNLQSGNNQGPFPPKDSRFTTKETGEFKTDFASNFDNAGKGNSEPANNNSFDAFFNSISSGISKSNGNLETDGNPWQVSSGVPQTNSKNPFF